MEVLEDSQAETDETFNVVLSSQVNAVLGKDVGVGTIEDDDEGTVVTIHAQEPYGGTEEGESAVFILQRVNGTLGIFVDIEISQQGEFLWNLQPSPVTKEIPAGVNELRVEITTIDDSTVEANGSVTATVQPGGGYSPGKPDTATVNIRDNDRTLSIADAEEGEGQGSMTFTVTLSAAAENRVTVEAYTQSGKATASSAVTETSLGQDFVGRNERLVFEPGETEKSFTVTLVDDDIDESPEEFTVRLSRPSRNVWLTDAAATATGTINDNDDPMNARIFREVRRVDEDRGRAVRFAVELTHSDTVASERDTKLFWEVKPGTATDDLDFAKPYSQQRGTLAIPIGHLTSAIEVNLIDDDLLEMELETFTVELVEAQRLVIPDEENGKKIQISIRDDERLSAAIAPREDSVIEGDNAVFEVRLSGGVTMDKTVLEYTVTGTAESGSDYTAPSGTLTIPAGRDTGTITIPTKDDSALDPDETLEVTLTSGKSGSRNANIPDPTATATILDPGTITVSVSPAEAEEGGTLSFALTLSEASQSDVTVDWETADDPGAEFAATADVDYVAAASTLIVPAGNTSAVITVRTIDDTRAAEGTETFRLDLTHARIDSGPDAEDLPLGVSTAVGAVLDNDIAPTRITLTATPDRVSEDAGATALTVTAALNGQRSLANDTRVRLALEDGAAAADEDYEAATAWLTIPAGEMTATATLTLDPVNDAVREGDETVSITGDADGLAVTTAQVTITDDDTAPTGVTLTLAPGAIGEGAGETELTVTATLTGGDLRGVDTRVTLLVEGVSLTLDDGATTAAATAADFAADAVTLTIPAGRMNGSATLAFTPVDDTLAEGNETAQVSGAAEGLTVTPANMTIEDNDQEPTRIVLSASPAEVTEGDGATTLTVTAYLEGGSARISDTEVSLTVGGLTARPGADFTAQDGVTLTIPAGRMSHTADLTITLVDDDVAENAELFEVRGSNAEPGLPVSGVRITLSDNDARPTSATLSIDRNTVREDGGAQRLTVTAVLDGSSRLTVDTSVRLTLVGKTAAESDYSALTGVLTIPAGQRKGAATLVLVPTDDYIDEADETLEVQGSTSESRSGPQLEVSGVVVTIRDDDTAGVTTTPTELSVVEGGSSSYGVALDTQPGADVTVAVSGHSGTDITVSGTTLTSDTLTFTADNWNTAQTVTVSAAQNNDVADKADVTLTHTVTGTAEYAGVTADSVTVTITDDDTVGVTVSETELEIDEGASATYTVKLDTEPTDSVTVAITGHADTDITLSGATLSNDTLTFTASNWNATQTVTVTAAQDDDAVEEEEATLTHTANGGGYVDVQETVTVTIVEKDTAGVTISKTALEIDEGATATYTVKLDTEPTDDVRVAIAGHADTDVTLDKTSLTFTSDNWNTAQTVTLSAAQDDDAASDAAVTLTHTANGGGYVDVQETMTVTIVEKDTAVLSVLDAQAAEDGGNVVFTVSISAATGEAVTVDYTTSNGTATAGQDYTETTGTLTFPANSVASQTISVPVTDDTVDEAEEDETFTLTLSNVQEASLAGGGSTLDATGTITDNDDPTVTARFEQTDYSVDEGGTVQVTMILNKDPEREVTIRLVHGLRGGISDADYSGVPVSLEFRSGETEKSFTFTATADDIDDDGESLALTFRTPMPVGVTAGATTTVTITDDDDPTVTANFVQATSSVDEGGTVDVTVTLSADPERDVTILLTHDPQGGASSDDYGGVPESLVFRNGDTEKSFTFSATGDDIDDDGESVALGFGALPMGVTAGATTTVTITDDDTAGVTISATSLSIDEGATATYTVVLDTEPTDSVTVAIAGHADTDITLSGATLTSDALTFTASNWNTAQTVTVSAAEDDDAASDAAVTLTHTANGGGYVDVQETVTVTIVEKDTSVLSVGDAQAVEEGGDAVFTVSISAATDEEVTVNYATSDGTARADQDYTETSGTLTFPANSVASQTISVPVTDDTVDEVEQTFTLTLSNAEGASLAGGGSTLDATGTITDNDDPTVTARFEQTDYSVDEGGTVQVTMILNKDPEREVTIRLVHGLRGGISDADYSGVPATLVFRSGETEKSFTFTATADDIDDDGESLALTFRTPMPEGVTAGATTTVTITDDDMAGVTVSATSLSIDEGGNATYTVKLDSQPTGNVTVAIAGHANTDITLSGATLTNDALTFTADNWNTAQTVRVTAAQDDDAVDEEEATLTHTVTGGDYDEVKADDVTVNVADNDTASPSLDLSLPVPTHNDADGSGDVTLNDGLTYTATATNDGNVPLSGVTLSDLLVDKDGRNCGSLDIGEQCQLTGAHTVTQTDVDAGLVTNSVTADANELTTAVTASQQTRVAQERALALTKTTTTTGFAAVGEQIAYTYTVSNSGTVTLSGTLAISDDKIASTDITCGAVPDGGLVPSASVTCSGTYTVVQADLDADGVTNKASTSLDGVTSNEATATVPWVPQQTDTDPQVSIALAVQVAENGGTVEVAVTLSESGLQTVTVDYATSDGTATAGADYTSASNTLTFAPGTTEQKIRVTVIDDAVDEDEEDETFTVALTNPINASLGNSASTVTITDNDDPTVTANFAQASYSVDEGGTVQVTVTLSADPEREVTILLVHGLHGGISDADYSGVPVSLVFRSGETENSFTFRAAGDDIDDDGESLALTFRTPMPAGVTAGATTTVSITDDDTAGVTISKTALEIDEGASATYTVVLDTEPTAGVTVTVTGASGDVSVDDTTLTFTADNWDTAQTVTVTAARDDDAASDASVTLTHTANGGDYVDVEETVTVTIVEKDASVLSVSDEHAAENGGNMVFTVSISAAAGEAVTVSYATSNGTATAGQDYTETSGTLTFPANSVVSRTVSVPVTDDTVDEAEEETFTLTLSNVHEASLAGGDSTLAATGTITDNDDPQVTVSFGQASYSVDEGGTVQVTVTLSADPEREVTIRLVHGLRGGISDADYSGVPASLVFQSGDTEKSFTFRAAGDDIDDDGESVALTFRTPMPAGVTAGATTTVTITDDDTAGVTISKTALEIDEGASATYTVVLDTEPTAGVAITVTGTSGDVSVDNTTLTFTASNWNTAQTVKVSAAEDDDAIADDAVTITHATSGGGYADTEVPSIRVSITENDAPGVIIAPTELTVGEGETGQYTVVLDTLPSDNVTVDIAVPSGTDVSVSPSSRLTFTSDNWSQAQTVTVSAAEDDDTDADPAVTLTHTVAGGDYQGQRAAGVMVTITDNDQVEPPTPQPSVTVSFEKDYHNLSEGASGGAGVGILLSAALESDVTIPIGVLPQSTASSEDYSGVPNGITFAAGETYTYFRVHPVADTVEEEDEQVWLGLGSLPDGVSAGNYSQTYVRIVDAARVSFGSSSYEATEGRDDAVVTVRLNKPLPHDVSIPLTAEGGSGATSDDWSGVPQKLTFTAGDTEKTFTVIAVDDTVEDDGEMVTFGFGTLSDRLIAVSPATTVVTLMNMEDDPDAADPPVPTSPHCQGTTAAVGSVYTGTIETAGETDWWSVELAPHESYTIHTRGADTGDDSLPRAETLQFSRSDGGFFTAYRHSTAVGIPTSLLAEFNIWLTKPGIYCFEVGTREANGQGTYRLEVESHGYNHNYDVPADTNTEKTFATPVTRYTSYGFLGDHGGSEPDEDWFRAPLEGRVAYRILLSADTNEEERHQLTRPKVVGIHHPNGTAIDGTASTSTGKSVSVDFTPARSGDYYIAVGSNSGDATGMLVLCARVIAQGDADNCGGRDNPYSGYAPPRAPRNLRVSQGNSQELDVSWERVSSSSGPGKDTPTYGYKVQWKKASDSWDDGDEVTVSHRVPGASYTITGLDNGVEYTVRVRAFNFMGVGDASEEVSGSPEQGQETDLQAYNSPATGGPGISGTPRVGETLAATTEGISDEDGLTGAVFGYQWIRHDFGTGTDTDIDGATGASYTVTSYDAVHGIRVRVSFIDDASNKETLTSYAVAAPAPPLTADFPQSPYQSLSHKGADDRPQVIVEFSRAVAALAKTTPSVSVTGGAVYSVLAHEEDGLEHAWVFFLDPTGTDEIRFSLLTGQSCEAGGICAADGTTLSVAPGTRIIPGLEEEEDETEPQEGQPKKQEPKEPPPAPQNLAAMVNEDGSVTLNWDAPDDDSVTGYQILRRRPTMDEEALLVHVEDTGSAATTYTDSDVTEGVRHVYRLKAINATGLSESSNYVNVDPPEREANDRATGAPTISGTVQVGETLTADTSGIADEDGLDNAAFTYQWLADDAAIAGATGSAYTLADGDEGKTIAVEVSFTDDEGNEEMLTSAATASVAEATQPNNPATGVPTISGTVQVGETLTADTSGIEDEDGLDDAVFGYQWLAGDSDISGATGSTYTLADADEGKTVKVQVSFTDDADNEETLTSAATDAVSAAPQPNNPSTGAPAITGTAQVGETLTADTSGIADEDGLDNAAFSYQWLADDADISGATGSAYTLADADEGKTVKVEVSFTDDEGNEEMLTSAATASVAEATQPNNPATGVPTISGTVQVGETLTADTSGIEDEDGLDDAVFGYQWLAGDSDISGATGSTYTLADADEGKTVKVQVSFTDDADNEETLTSAATDAVSAAPQPNNPSTGAPAITGTAQVGETLTADTSGIADEDGLDNAAFSYQWLADDADISGATGSAYTLADADEGKTVKVRVSFTDDGGNDETLTSAATEAVAGNEEPVASEDLAAWSAIMTVEWVYQGYGYYSTDAKKAGSLSPASFEVDGTTYTVNMVETQGWWMYIGVDRELPFDFVLELDGVRFASNDASFRSYSYGNIYRWEGTGLSLRDGDAVEVRLLRAFEDETAVNSAATGAPAITGTAQVGETLTADTSDIADEDGLDNAAFTYQWLADDADISGATGSTYTLADDDDGKAITVRVSFTDDEGNEEMLTSAATASVAEAPTPNNPSTGAPTISGTAQVGETLTADTSDMADEDGMDNAAFTYQWLADDAAIAGATGSTYTLADGDEGKAITVRVSFTDDADNEETLTSAATDPVAKATQPNNPATGVPTISGTVQVGETLTADTSDIADEDGMDNAAFAYQWLADDAAIAGATGSTYTLVEADEGKTIKVRVSFTDDEGNDETLTSAATVAVAVPLTASLENTPDTHDGQNVFTFELRFSEKPRLSYRTLRDHAFTVAGGTVEKAERITQGSNIRWRITVRPDGDGQVTITLPATTNCDVEEAICTGDGRMLSNELALTVDGPGQ